MKTDDPRLVFTLIHPVGSDRESDSLEAAERLAAIPGVEAFELLAEVSPKNNYRFGISMEFSDRAVYEQYIEPYTNSTTGTQITSASYRSAGCPR